MKALIAALSVATTLAAGTALAQPFTAPAVKDAKGLSLQL
jgi:hypothetical protein